MSAISKKLCSAKGQTMLMERQLGRLKTRNAAWHCAALAILLLLPLPPPLSTSSPAVHGHAITAPLTRPPSPPLLTLPLTHHYSHLPGSSYSHRRRLEGSYQTAKRRGSARQLSPAPEVQGEGYGLERRVSSFVMTREHQTMLAAHDRDRQRNHRRRWQQQQQQQQMEQQQQQLEQRWKKEQGDDMEMFGFQQELTWQQHASPQQQRREQQQQQEAQEREVNSRRLQAAADSKAVDGALFLLEGNAEPTVAGLYWTTVELGSGGQKFKVQIDSGSDLVWVNCQPCFSCPSSSAITGLSAPFDTTLSSSVSVLSCKDDLCSRMQRQESRLGEGCHSDQPNDKRCIYKLQYGDLSTSYGYLLKDKMSFTQLDAQQGNTDIVFGCGYNQSGNLVRGGAVVDGLLGLGQGPISLVTQMQSAGLSNGLFAHCLGGEDVGGGTLLLGSIKEQGVSYTALKYPHRSQFIVQLTGLSVGSNPPLLDSSSSSPSPLTSEAIFDSGTTLALFPEEIFNPWKDAVIAEVKGLSRMQSSDLICFDFSSKTSADLALHFPNVTLRFGSSTMELMAENYIIMHSDGDAACIGWQSTRSSLDGSDSFIILGDIVLRDQLVIYDSDNGQLGWTHFDCSSGTITAADGAQYNVSIVVGDTSKSSVQRCATWQFATSLLMSLVVLLMLQ